jgi:hypothetical protein
MPYGGSPVRVGAAAVLLLCALLAFVGCAQRVAGADVAPPSECQATIILGLAAPAPPPPDERWVQQLAAASGVRLHFVRAITPSLYLFRMRATGSAGGCPAAIERLRADPRLHSAEIDQQRKHESG